MTRPMPLNLFQILALFFLVSPSIAHASDTDFYYDFTSKGEDVELHLRKFKNAFNQIEVDAALVETHWLMPDTESPLLYGIDRDGDGYPETWFYRKASFVEKVFFHPPEDQRTFYRSPNGEDAIMDIVGHLQLNERWMSEVIMSRGAGFLSSAISSGQAALEQFFQDQLYIYELDFAANDLPDNSSDVAVLRAMSERAWDLAAKTVSDQTGGATYLERGAVDMLLFAVGMKAFKYIGKAGSWAVKKIATTEAGGAMISTMEDLAARVESQITGIADAATTATVDVMSMGLESLRTSAIGAVRFLGARKKLAQEVLKKFATGTGTIYKTGFREWDYVLQTQGLQVFAEAWARKDEIYDPNPVVMGKKLFEDKDFLQNFAFMTNETLLQTGVHTGKGTTSQRLLLAGFVSLVDSGLMNFAIKGNVDGTRAAGDTGWEMTIGNFQTLLDNAVFRKSGRSMIQNSSTLGGKLVGYAIYWVAPAMDQLVGYVGYSKATSAYEVWKKSADENKPVPKEALPTLKMVPIEVMP